MAIFEKIEIADKVQEIADAVYNKGKKDEYDAFWDKYQQNGTREYYDYSFYEEGWTDETFKPKYPIAPISAQYCFTLSLLTHIPCLDLSNCTKAGRMLNNSAVERIDRMIFSANTSLSNMFSGASSLIDVGFEGMIAKDINLEPCELLSKASIESLVDCLSGTSPGNTAYMNPDAINNAYGIDVYDETTYTEEYLNLLAKKPKWEIWCD